MSFMIALSIFAVTMTKVAGPAGSCIKVAGTFIAMAVALNLMVLAFKFLDTCKPEQLTTNALLLVELIAAMSLLALVLGLVRPNPGSAMVLIAMARICFRSVPPLDLWSRYLSPMERDQALMRPATPICM